MIKETIRRFKSKTPKYFKILRKACIAMSTASALALSLKENLPTWVQYITPQMLTMGLVGSFISSLPEDKEEDKKEA